MAKEVKARCEKDMVVRCEADGHEYVLDHSDPKNPDKSLEGTSPGGALMVALAGCKAMVVRMFLSARKIDAPIDIKISMDGDNASGKFAAHAKVEIHIDAELSEKDRRLIEEFVDSKCAVEQIILGTENTIETSYSFA